MVPQTGGLKTDVSAQHSGSWQAKASAELVPPRAVGRVRPLPPTPAAARASAAFLGWWVRRPDRGCHVPVVFSPRVSVPVSALPLSVKTPVVLGYDL